jgi:hypothetical protein
MKTAEPAPQIQNCRAATRLGAKTEAVFRALENELACIEGEKSLRERLAAILRTGAKADKDFYDNVSGESAT